MFNLKPRNIERANDITNGERLTVWDEEYQRYVFKQPFIRMLDIANILGRYEDYDSFASIIRKLVSKNKYIPFNKDKRKQPNDIESLRTGWIKVNTVNGLRKLNISDENANGSFYIEIDSRRIVIPFRRLSFKDGELTLQICDKESRVNYVIISRLLLENNKYEIVSNDIFETTEMGTEVFYDGTVKFNNNRAIYDIQCENKPPEGMFYISVPTNDGGNLLKGICFKEAIFEQDELTLITDRSKEYLKGTDHRVKVPPCVVIPRKILMDANWRIGLKNRV